MAILHVSAWSVVAVLALLVAAVQARELSLKGSNTTIATALNTTSKWSTYGTEWSGWYSARATAYGFPGDPWSIMEGSCEYYNLWGDKATGWDIAALSDQDRFYSGGCGKCFEVKCDPSWISDGYGEKFDRSNVCYDTSSSVVVQITDTCPCYYPTNLWSNKRWCCGDMPHFDLSIWTFQKLADIKWGVVGLQARQVPCGYQVNKRAPVPNNPQYPEGYNKISNNWVDRRPWPANTPYTY